MATSVFIKKKKKERKVITTVVQTPQTPLGDGELRVSATAAGGSNPVLHGGMGWGHRGLLP